MEFLKKLREIIPCAICRRARIYEEVATRSGRAPTLLRRVE